MGRRLRDERKRLGLSQAEFGALGGVGLHSQGRYESGKPSDADYLGGLAENGVDVIYVLTGRRGESSVMGPQASELLTDFLIMPADMQAALMHVARAMRNQSIQAPAATLHAPETEYRMKS